MDWPAVLTLIGSGLVCAAGATGGFEQGGWIGRVLAWRRQPKPTEWERLRTLHRQLRVEEATEWQRQFDALDPDRQAPIAVRVIDPRPVDIDGQVVFVSDVQNTSWAQRERDEAYRLYTAGVINYALLNHRLHDISKEQRLHGQPGHRGW